MAAPAWAMLILIWTARKSVCHETNGRVKVHGDGTRADGRRLECCARINEIVGRSTHTVSFQTCAVAGLAAAPAANAAFMQAPGPHAPEPRAPPISLQLCATQSGAGARFADDF